MPDRDAGARSVSLEDGDFAAEGSGLWIGPPATSPCRFCPYRRDVPSGIWHAQEYAKLAMYDLPTMQQLPGLFTCHLHDEDSEQRQACAGWAGCHEGDELLALRLAVMSGLIDEEILNAIRAYESPVPLFASGAQAAEHGLSDIDRPGAAALKAIQKLTSIRTDLAY